MTIRCVISQLLVSNTPLLGPPGEELEVNFARQLGIQGHGRCYLRIGSGWLTGSIGLQMNLVHCNKL